MTQGKHVVNWLYIEQIEHSLVKGRWNPQVIILYSKVHGESIWEEWLLYRIVWMKHHESSAYGCTNNRQITILDDCWDRTEVILHVSQRAGFVLECSWKIKPGFLIVWSSQVFPSVHELITYGWTHKQPTREKPIGWILSGFCISSFCVSWLSTLHNWRFVVEFGFCSSY